jgi:SAM-dependent methyltransferase
MPLKRLLNVGGGDKAIPLPPQYAEFEHCLLDIDPKGSPDILCDARELSMLEAGQFDGVYCSHNLEHYFHHDVPKVLAGFMHVLKDGGFAQILVPDLLEVMRTTIDQGMDVNDVLYQAPSGPITVLDVLYGYDAEIERSGQDFYAHKTGFTRKSLLDALREAGFSKTYSRVDNFEIDALAFKGIPDPALRSLFNLPQD